jgi:hypothetical protein
MLMVEIGYLYIGNLSLVDCVSKLEDFIAVIMNGQGKSFLSSLKAL